MTDGTEISETIQLPAEEDRAYARHLIDIAADMVISVDGRRLVNLFNKKAEEVYGYTEAEMLGQPITRLYDDPTEYDRVGALLRQQGRYTGEITSRKKNGEIFPVFITAILLHDSAGRVIGSVGYSRDLTAEKKAAAVEREYLAMLGEEKLKREVENITRHDMKSPLNSVIGFADLLLEDDTLEEAHKEIVRIIYNSGMKALRTVNLSLDLLKIEQGVYVPDPQVVRLLPVLLDVQTDHANMIRNKRVSVVFLLHDQPQETEQLRAQRADWLVLGEEIMCYNIFANLLKNAIEAAPPGSTITCRLSFEEGGAGQIRVVLHNQGAVPEKIRDRFFEKSATAGKKGGTGLGTYSALRLTQTLGGQISMESDSAHGTTLTVILPKPPPGMAPVPSRRGTLAP
ncbi:MAG: PAS domain-containing sensor histidine kinase [Magnetococcus sp. MYC-9]